MIRHIVFYKFASQADMKAAEEVLLSMKGRIDLIKDIEVGRDFLGSERSFMLALMVTLDSKADLEAYQSHPYHLDPVKKTMHQLVTQAASVDYEL